LSKSNTTAPIGPEKGKEMIKAPGEHHQGHILDTHEHKDDMSQNVRQIAKQRNASFVSAFFAPAHGG